MCTVPGSPSWLRGARRALLVAVAAVALLSASAASSGPTAGAPLAGGPPETRPGSEIVMGGRRLLASEDDDGLFDDADAEFVNVPCDLAQSAAAEFQYETQWTCKDPSVKTIRDVTLVECQSECTCRSFCGAFSFNPEKQNCYLKLVCNLGQSNEIDITGIKGSTSAPSYQPPPDAPVYLYYWDYRCADSSIKVLWGKSQPQCEQACSSTNGCTAYSLKSWGKCELKASCNQLVFDATFSSAKLEATSVPPAIVTDPKFVDVSGPLYLDGQYCADPTVNILWNKNEFECESACVSTSGCQAYSVNTWGKCELKASCEVAVPDPIFTSVRLGTVDDKDSDSEEQNSEPPSQKESESESEMTADDDSQEASEEDKDKDGDDDGDDDADDDADDDGDDDGWGSVTDYREGCEGVDDDEGDFTQSYCHAAHCMANCQEIGLNGLFVYDDFDGKPFCDSLHTDDMYDSDRVCCCAKYVPDMSEVTIPCIVGYDDDDEDDDGDVDGSCYFWCRLKSYELKPSGSTDCDPGYGFCLPFGNVLPADECEDYDDDEFADIECAKDGECCVCDRFT